MSGALRRAFVAVVPPSPVLRWSESLVDSARRKGDGLRWTRPEQRHVTLQFLGRVDNVDSLVESLGESLRRIAPFGVGLGGAGAFPSARRASVVWLGVIGGAAELGELAASVAEATAVVGSPAEARPFRAHLTVARSTQARDVRATVASLHGGAAGPPWRVEEVVLFESDTRRESAVHTEVASFPLASQ